MSAWKPVLFRLLGLDPEAVIASFWTGDDELVLRMVEEIRSLVPDRHHCVVSVGRKPAIEGCTMIVLRPSGAGDLYLQLRRAFRGKRIALAPVLFTGEPHPLRRAACCWARRKILAYNAALERHHLKLSTAIASFLFLRGVPLDRIWLRPGWLLPWRRDRTCIPDQHAIRDGRPVAPGRRRVAVLSPYFPYPLAHGGAVRIFHLLREASREFDLFLFAFAKEPARQEFDPLLEFCAQVVTVEPPYYREPRWSTLRPPEAGEFFSPPMQRLLRQFPCDLVQVEYTHLADYGGDVLVAHDVTWDLHRQVHERRRTLSAWWDYVRWKRFETGAVRRFARVVAMSAKDAALLRSSNARVIENGVDLDRFRPEPESPGERLMFVGSFNHFPNIEAFRFFHDQVWPRLRERFPLMTLTVVAGRDHRLYWQRFTGLAEPPADPRIRMLDLVRDVRPLYVEANLVIVPTPVSAGTNLKVLEAMAMERTVVSTTCGCAGLELAHGDSVWIGDDAESFAEGVARLIEAPHERARLARAARAIAEQNFDWKVLGEKQRELWRELLSHPSLYGGR